MQLIRRSTRSVVVEFYHGMAPQATASNHQCRIQASVLLQTWFQNKRRRNRNKSADAAPAALSPATPATAGLSTAAEAIAVASETGAAHTEASAAVSGGVSGSSYAPCIPVATSEEVIAAIDDLFASRSEYAAVLGAAYSLVPNLRPDGPPLGFVFDSPQDAAAAAAGGSKRKATAQSTPAGVAKVARKAVAAAVDPHQLMQRKLEEEERNLKKQQEKWLREQAKADESLKKESEKRERETERERSRMMKETARCASLRTIPQAATQSLPVPVFAFLQGVCAGPHAS
jgi:hypothetical protein